MSMMTDKEHKNREELFRLIEENPELPIIPMVDGEISADDCGWWIGALGYAQVDEYLFVNDGVVFKSDDEIFNALERFLPDDEFEKLPEVEEECRPYYEALPWKRAIIVYIVLPEWEVNR